MSRKLVYGVGINDADYQVSTWVDGRKVLCEFYDKWKSMLERCYSSKFLNKNPTYFGCSVCNDWLKFSSFKQWMISLDYKNKQLDKDLLINGNKIYSPEACAFVDGITNRFINDHAFSRGNMPIGVTFSCGKYRAQCSNPFSGKREHLGCFSCPVEAHLAWKSRKNQLACKLADLQTD